MYYILSVFVFFLIATAFSVNKIILTSMTPGLFVFLRMGISGILLLLIFCRKKEIWKKAKKNLNNLFLISCFTTFIPSLLRAYAISVIPSSRASFWGAFEPFITAIYMYFMFGEKLTKNKLIGSILGFIGAIFFIYTNQNMGSFKATFYFCLADIAQIMSVVFSRYGWLNGQKLLKEKIFSPQQMNGFTFTISSIVTLIFTIIIGGSAAFKISYSCKLLYLMIYTVVVGNMIAYSLYGYLLKKCNATFVSLAGLTVPLFVHLLGPFFLKEEISVYFFVSLSFIFLALYFFNKR